MDINYYQDAATYRPEPFRPIDPVDDTACYMTVPLLMDASGTYRMYTVPENMGGGELFDVNTIVECYYDVVARNWIPIRVRHDKTYEYRAGLVCFGNDFATANNIWYSIFKPVTEDILTNPTFMDSGGNSNTIENATTATSWEWIQNGDLSTLPPNLAEQQAQHDYQEQVYYNTNNGINNARHLGNTAYYKASAGCMRDFHNLFVKTNLLHGACRKFNNPILLDVACGKGGDLAKWIHSKCAFVLGIDVSADNIHNPMDGACARYLNRLRQQQMYTSSVANGSIFPHVIFVTGNVAKEPQSTVTTDDATSDDDDDEAEKEEDDEEKEQKPKKLTKTAAAATDILTIRSGRAMATEKDEAIVCYIFGSMPTHLANVSDASLGSAVVRQRGRAAQGFDVCSCQFALHYFAKNAATWYTFMANLAESVALGGVFAATCFDGMAVWRQLCSSQTTWKIYMQQPLTTVTLEQTTMETATIEQTPMEPLLCAITPLFSFDELSITTFEEGGAASLGYGIDVYQESIKQTLTEYLVHPQLVAESMSSFGFQLMSDEEARELGIATGQATGTFEDMFNSMCSTATTTPIRNAVNMTSSEKEVSFLNRYYIFVKTHQVRNAKQLARDHIVASLK